MEAKINPQMLILAREIRGLSQTELATETEISQSRLSKYEADITPIPSNELDVLSGKLRFPREFFEREGKRYGPESGEMFHRKRRSLTHEDMRPLHALINVLRLNNDILLEQIDTKYENVVPRYNVSTYDGRVEKIAAAVRALWGIPSGPVPNMMKVLEDAFCMVFAWDFGTDRLDEITQWVGFAPPVMLVNMETPGDRLRFSLAHALGHMIMHHQIDPYPEMETEADQFAAEFLMPAEDIVDDFRTTTLEHLGQIKPKWKVSIQALIERAKDLEIIGQDRYESLQKAISKKGYRKNEPFAIVREKPTLFTRIIELYEDDLDWTPLQIAQTLSITPSDFKRWYYPRPKGLELSIVKPPDSTGGTLAG